MSKEGGYTVLETGLALGVSAALVILTFGLGTMVGRRRFQDSLTTTQSFIQTQYNEVRSGINSRYGGASGSILDCGADSAGNSANCYTVGRLLTFGTDGSGNGEVRSSFIVARVADSAWPDTEKTSIENLRDVSLYAVTGDSADAGLRPAVENMGGNQIIHAWSVTNGSTTSHDVAATNVALLRSPLDGSLIVASNVQLGSDDGSGVQSVTLQDNPGSGSDTNMLPSDKIAIGITNGGVGQQGGLICIAGGDNSASVSNNNNVNLNDLVGDSSLVNESCGNWE